MEMSFPSLGLERKICLHKTGEAKKSWIWGPVSLHSFASFLFARDKNVSPLRNLVTGVMRKAPAFVTDPHSILEGQSKDRDSWSRTSSVQDRPLDSRRRPFFYISLTPDLQHRTCSEDSTLMSQWPSRVPISVAYYPDAQASAYECGRIPIFCSKCHCQSRMEKKRVLVKVWGACLCSVNP